MDVEFTLAERDLPAGRLHQRKEALVRELKSWDERARRRRRRLVLALLAMVTVLLAATGFMTYTLTRGPTHLESIGCYDRASLASNVAVVEADGRSPTAICEDVWRRGDLVGAPKPDRLAACVLESGAIGVFPSSGASTCEALGLGDLPASYSEKARRFAALRNAIVARVGAPPSGSSRGGPQCVEETEARAIVRRALDSGGFADWTVQAAGGEFTDAKPCASVSLDWAAKTAFLIPRSRSG
jgi:hypothetical protein